MKINTTVRNAAQAQSLIADLLLTFSKPVAFERLRQDAVDAHQSLEEEAQRSAGNLLTSFVTRKPNGSVVDFK